MRPRSADAGGSFRQSMAWLHNWTGLVVGWVLFFIFLTGTFAYVNDEVDHWMRPEEPMLVVLPPATDLLAKAEHRLAVRAPDAGQWSIQLPGGRGANELRIGWRQAATERGQSETLDPTSGRPIHYQVRETGGGYTLYWMHFFLHYVPQEIGIRIVGICSMLMLVAILSGVVTHRKIFRDFFTFRPAKGQRSWLDAHNLLGVTALPFHLMITWSGLIFYLFAYMPMPLDALYPQGAVREQFRDYAYGIPGPREEARNVEQRAALAARAPLAPLAPMLGVAEAQWGKGKVAGLRIDAPGRANALVTVTSRETLTLGRRDAPELCFDGVTGKPIPLPPDTRAGPDRFDSVMLGLHEAHFAGPLLRFLFVVAGLAGTAMIATGVLLWSAKRKARLKVGERPHIGIALVDTLNLGTIIGLPIGIAAYFWANRLLPAAMENRAAWEMHSIFIAWGCAFLVALWRPRARAWPELCWIAAAACGLLPVLNALTTERHLGITIPAGDWVLAGFDLSAFAAGLFFACLAHRTARKYARAPDRIGVAT